MDLTLSLVLGRPCLRHQGALQPGWAERPAARLEDPGRPGAPSFLESKPAECRARLSAGVSFKMQHFKTVQNLKVCLKPRSLIPLKASDFASEKY